MTSLHEAWRFVSHISENHDFQVSSLCKSNNNIDRNKPQPDFQHKDMPGLPLPLVSIYQSLHPY